MARRFLQFCLVVAAIWLSAEIGSRLWLHSVLSHGWPTRSGALKEAATLVPDQPTNDAARRIEILASRLAVDIVPRRSSSSRSAVDPSPWKAIQEPVKAYVAQAIVSPQREPHAAPAVFVDFLTKHSSDLDALVNQLETGNAPSWEIRSSSGFEAPLPNLAGHLTLTRMLVAAALQASSIGDDPRGWRYLHSATVLADPLFTRPELISQLVGFAEANLIVGTMRQLDGAPEWSLRWPAFDLRDALARSAVIEAWPMYKPFSGSAFTDIFTAFAGKEHPPTLGGRLFSLAFGPYLMASAANSASIHRRIIREYAASSPCDQHIRTVKSDVIPSWNLFGRIAFTGETLGRAYSRLHHLLAHVEGTRLILEARRQKAATGSWPSSTPAVDPVCAQPVWAYDVRSNQLHTRAVVPIAPFQSKGATNLPQEHVE